jgi:ribonuclease HI
LIDDNDNIKSLEAMKKWKPKLKNIQHKEWNKGKENFKLLKTKPWKEIEEMITPQEIETSRKGIFLKEIWESNQEMKIFTDGSKITNKEGKEIAAYAVYNSTTKKEELGRINGKQDKFKAELTAIMRAIQLTKKDQKITIITDSMLSIQCIKSRIIKNQEPRRSLNKNKIINRDILETIKDEIYDRGEDSVKFQWIEAHTNIQTGDYFYNNIADTLAKEAKYLDDN